MHYAFAWFSAAVGVTLLVDVVAAQALDILWRPWYRSFIAVVFFAAMLEVAFVIIGCLGYKFTSMKRRVLTTRNRALLSGASFAAVLLPLSMFTFAAALRRTKSTGTLAHR
jgi:hypothetical protein